jgi:hypothetical protein
MLEAAFFFGKFVILSAAKNLRDFGQILRFAQNDRLARIPCHTLNACRAGKKC